METDLEPVSLQINPEFRYPRGVLSPWVFAYAVLGVRGLYAWQGEAMEAVGQGLATALVAANGSGKTRRVMAPMALWVLYSWRRAVVKLTSASWDQVIELIMPAIHGFEPRLRCLGWRWLKTYIETPEGGFISAFSTNEPGRAEGHHGNADAPLFYGIDEAKSVDESIFVASDRCTAQYRLLSSNPGGPSGRFYDCFNRLREFYYGIRVTSYDCPHIPEATRKKDLKMYGLDNPAYRSKHLAEFTDDDTFPVVIRPEWIRGALAEPPEFVQGPKRAYCDFAAGGAENVIAVAEGNRAYIAAAWRNVDTVQAAREFIAEFKRLDLKPGQVSGDEGGLGHVMIDQIEELGFRIVRVNNAHPALDEEHYCNLGSEMWFVGARRIEKREVILPNDRIFFEQAVNRRREYDTKMRLRAEPKDKMAGRGVVSPDRADAIMGVIGLEIHQPTFRTARIGGI